MNKANSILLGVFIVLFLIGIGFLSGYYGLQGNEFIQSDSIAVKKDLAAPVFVSGKIAATIDNCKIYEMTTENRGWVYVIVCVDEKGKVISTAITK